MADIRVHIHIPDGRSESIEAPANLKVKEFLDDLVVALKLAQKKWTIFDKNSGLSLDPERTLEGNGVRPDDHLSLSEDRPELKTESEGESSRTPKPGEGSARSPGHEGIRCAKCGAENPSGNKFCAACGGSLTTMPPDLKLHVHTPDGQTRPLEASVEIEVGELITELIKAGIVPEKDSQGRPAQWMISDREGGQSLRQGITLKDQGVHPGDHLYVIERRVPPKPKLYIHTPDGRTHAIEVSIELDAGELIVELIKAGIVPEKDSQGRPAQWMISDREGGQSLRQGITLKEQGVHPDDHLYVIGKRTLPEPTLHFHTPDGSTYSVELSVDLDVGEIITELIKAAIVPEKDSQGRQAQWVLSQRTGGQTLVQGRSLRQQGVRPGDHLYIRSVPSAPEPKNYKRAMIAIGVAGLIAVAIFLVHHSWPPATISISPPSYTFRTSGILVFTARVTGSSKQNVTWSTTCPDSNVSADGTYVFTAPSANLSTTCAVTASGANGLSTSATVRLLHKSTPPPPLVAVSISPLSANLRAGQRQEFKAAVRGTQNTSITWSIQPKGAGTIRPLPENACVYTAPNSIQFGGTVVVAARSQAAPTQFATATVNLISGPVITHPKLPPPGSKPGSASPTAAPTPAGFGLVDVLTDPPGKQVYIDGNAVGVSPIRNLKVREGVHRFSWNGACSNYIDTGVKPNGYARVKLGCS